MSSPPSALSFSQRLTPWLWPALLAATIFYVSGDSQVAGPDIAGIDKVAHFAVYGLLATLIARVPGVPVLIAAALASAYGLTDELHQSFTPGRSVEWIDWCADTLGALTAVFIYSRWTAYRRWLEAPLFNSTPRADA